MVGRKRINEISDLIEEHGLERTTLLTGLDEESLKRYQRHQKEPEPEPLSKILILDIETAPMEVYVWTIWNKYVAQNQVISDWFIISFAVKWLFDSEVYSSVLTAEEIKNKDDKRIVKDLWEYVDEAEVIIAHNGRKFDMPKANTRFLKHGLMPPTTYLIIDTLDTLKKYFKVSSNKLNFVNAFLGIPQKTDTGGFELWSECMKGNEDSLASMETYNRNDVLILEELYVKLRPWIKPHPNVSLYSDDKDTCCPSCGGKRLEGAGHYATPVNRYQAWRCKDCGAIGRSRRSDTPASKKSNLLVSVAK